jgi:hypothetical protein
MGEKGNVAEQVAIDRSAAERAAASLARGASVGGADASAYVGGADATPQGAPDMGAMAALGGAAAAGGLGLAAARRKRDGEAAEGEDEQPAVETDEGARQAPPQTSEDATRLL